MLLFRSEEHVDRWCRSWRMERGGILTPRQAWGLAHAWFAPDRRDPAWRRPTVEQAEALLGSLGLVGEFWRLR